MKTMAYFVCHDFTNTLEVTTEPDSVGLNIHISQFGHEPVYYRVFLGKIDYFHIICFLPKNKSTYKFCFRKL